VPLSLFSNKRLSRMGIRKSMVGIFNFDPNMNNLNNKDLKLKINTGYSVPLTAIFFVTVAKTYLCLLVGRNSKFQFLQEWPFFKYGGAESLAFRTAISFLVR
jgi:hypothetical protein